jgi:hypothetical protein
MREASLVHETDRRTVSMHESLLDLTRRSLGSDEMDELMS